MYDSESFDMINNISKCHKCKENINNKDKFMFCVEGYKTSIRTWFQYYCDNCDIECKGCINFRDHITNYQVEIKGCCFQGDNSYVIETCCYCYNKDVFCDRCNDVLLKQHENFFENYMTPDHKTSCYIQENPNDQYDWNIYCDKPTCNPKCYQNGCCINGFYPEDLMISKDHKVDAWNKMLKIINILSEPGIKIILRETKESMSSSSCLHFFETKKCSVIDKFKKNGYVNMTYIHTTQDRYIKFEYDNFVIGVTIPINTKLSNSIWVFDI
jgi:hypothetical protein